MNTAKEKHAAILTKIKALSPSAVLIAVSKTQPISAIEELYRAGQRDFGENYAQELVTKAIQLKERCPEIRWHFIGHLQSNKLKNLVPHLACLHTIDSTKHAVEVARRWRESGRAGPLPVFIEVNMDQEASKAGLPPSEVPGVALEISRLGELELLGLMCIPASRVGRDASSAFLALRELEMACRPSTRGFLSMGMSADYEKALPLGATHVRVGTALFGPRTPL